MSTTPLKSHARSLKAPVMEVFASIQGEGLYVGEPQTFLRMAGCPLRCAWCDTPASWDLPPAEAQARIGLGSSRRRAAAHCTPFVAATWIGQAEEGAPRTLSLTGGEPLLWPQFIVELKTFVGSRRMHLETAGAHPAALQGVLGVIDHVSLDLKLPLDLGPPVPLAQAGQTEATPATELEWQAARRRCLELVAEHDACAKIILSGQRDERDYLPLLDDVANLAPKVPVILQPVTPMNGVSAASTDLIESLVERAMDRALDVRVIPQVHRLLRLP